MATKNPDWSSQADSEWNSIDSSTDIKSLMTSVKNALAQKKQTLKNVSKKSKGTSEKKKAAAKKLSSVVSDSLEIDPDAEARKLAGIKKQVFIVEKIDHLRFLVSQALASLSLVNKGTSDKLIEQHHNIANLINGAPDEVDKQTLKVELDQINVDIKQILSVVANNDHSTKTNKKPAFDRAKSFLGNDESPREINTPNEESTKRSFLSKGAVKALSVLGNINRNTKSLWTTASSKLGASFGTLSRSSPDSSFILNNPVVVKALKTIGVGTVATAKAVKDTESSTMKWLGSRLTGMAGRLMNFLRSPIQGSGLGSLIGMAALATTLIKPMLDGIDAELNSRFGENYIEKFVSGLWTKAWSYLVTQIKSFLGISEDANPLGTAANALKSFLGISEDANPLVTAANALKSFLGISEDAAPNSSLSPVQQKARDKALGDYRAALDKGSFLQKYYQIDLTPEQKAAKAKYEASMAVGDLNLNYTQNTGKSGSSTTQPVAGTSSPVNNVSNFSLLGGSGAPSTSVGIASPLSGPMESSPSSALSAPKATFSSAGEPVSNSSSFSSPRSALGVSQIPTFLSSESMTVYNLGILQ